MSTGNELQLPDETPQPGKIRDSNKTTLMALLEENGFSAYDRGIVSDEYVCKHSH
jgi:molybdopterin biosynthesis enzyme